VGEAGTRLFEIDWAEHWRRMVDERDRQVERLPRRSEAAGEQYWDHQADAVYRLWRSMAQPDPFMEALEPALTQDATVLDVGAGVGRYAFPIAERVRHVTAVEPSERMLSYLRRDAAESGVGNITTVGGSWEDVEVESADVVVCSHVVYGVRDIAGFMRKLDGHARRAVYVAIRVTQFDEYVRPLWERVWGEPRKPEPGLIELYNLLYAMGIPANVRLIPFGGFGGTRRFSSTEEAEEVAHVQLFLPEDMRPHPVVTEYVGRHLRPAGDGTLTWDFPPMRAAVVWWER
jgi:FkbM family methyltransferase